MFSTIMAGVIVFIISQFILKLILEPIVALEEKLGLLSSHLLRYQSIVVGGRAGEEVIDKIQELTAEVLSVANTIPCYSYFAIIGKVPSLNSILDTSRSMNVVIADLYQLSQSDHSQGTETPMERRSRLIEIGKNFRITTTYAVDPDKNL